jgi:N-acetyl-anhydromuramyl-L-alanine amidase AmpD
MRQIKYIVVHCTATSSTVKHQVILDGWRRKGWDKNGYHWLIDSDGLAARLQDDEIVSNGVFGYNNQSVNVCYIGGIVKGKAVDTRTEAQKGMLETILLEYRKKYPNAKILGHRDLSPDKNKNGIIESFEWIKICPCFDAKAEYKHI